MSSKCKNENGCKYYKIGSNNQGIFCDYMWALQVWLWSFVMELRCEPWKFIMELIRQHGNNKNTHRNEKNNKTQIVQQQQQNESK
jgi:hypothetical protein